MEKKEQRKIKIYLRFMKWMAPLIFGCHFAHATISMPLVCYYYDVKNSSENSSMFHAGFPWVWALDANDNYVYVEGEDVDGFLKVSELSSSQNGLFGWNMKSVHQNSSSVAKAFCENAVRKSFPSDYGHKRVLNFGAKSSFLSLTKRAPVFGDMQNEKGLPVINKIVIFGDSLSDQGNLKTWLRIVPRHPYEGGRFTNGRNWVDYFFQKTGIPIYNTAVGGSVTAPETSRENRQCTWKEEIVNLAHTTFSGSVDDELKKYLDEELSLGTINEPLNTLFIIFVGGNDYLDRLKSEYELDTFIDNPKDQFIGSDLINEQVTTNIQKHLIALAEKGAKNIMVLNLPNFGMIPKLLELSYHKETSESEDERLVRLSQGVSKIIQVHNKLLKEKTESLKEKYPQIKFIYGDVYSGLERTFSARHIFKSRTFFNYELDPDFMRLFSYKNQQALINKACYESDICKTPHRTIFWDFVHPTSYGHCLLAAGIHQKLYLEGLISKSSLEDYLKECRPDLFSW